VQASPTWQSPTLFLVSASGTLDGMRRLVLTCTVLAACGGDDGGGDGVVITPCDEGEPSHAGEATYYAADGSGNCSFDPSPGDLMVAAMNQTDYAGSAACGACITADGPLGSVTVRVVDRCPECAPGDVDFSAEAFARIADPAAGRVDIEWRYVPCDVAGPLRYHFKDGSSEFWTAIQVRNHRHAIATVEADDGGAWRDLPRENYNYFLAEDGLGRGPLTLRVTDVRGQVIEDSGIPLGDDTEASGADQFPACL
jgi:expansin (peptidoglycan-binding protein)